MTFLWKMSYNVNIHYQVAMFNSYVELPDGIPYNSVNPTSMLDVPLGKMKKPPLQQNSAEASFLQTPALH